MDLLHHESPLVLVGLEFLDVKNDLGLKLSYFQLTWRDSNIIKLSVAAVASRGIPAEFAKSLAA
jgi:hypothetical protein